MEMENVRTSRDIQAFYAGSEYLAKTLSQLPQNSHYIFYMSRGYTRINGNVRNVEISTALSEGAEPKFLDLWTNVIDCSGEVQGIEIRENEIICAMGFYKRRDDFGLTLCLVNPKTGLFRIGSDEDNADVSQVCIIDYENNTTIPFTNLCSRLGTGREDPYDYDKLMELVSDNPRNGIFIERRRKFNRLIASGEPSWLMSEVTLQLSDGLFTVYPHSFGYALNRDTPLAVVGMRREMIELDITTHTLSKVLEMIRVHYTTA